MEMSEKFFDEFIEENGHLVCPKCGSTNIEIHCGMFADRYVCKDCGYEAY